MRARGEAWHRASVKIGEPHYGSTLHLRASYPFWQVSSFNTLWAMVVGVGGASLFVMRQSPCLLAEQSPDTLQHTVLFGIIRVVLGGNLEDCWEGLVVFIDQWADLLSDLSIDERQREARLRSKKRKQWASEHWKGPPPFFFFFFAKKLGLRVGWSRWWQCPCAL